MTHLRNNHDYEILTPYGWCDFKGVSLNGEQEVYRLTLEDDSFVDATLDHIFFCNGVRVSLGDLLSNDCIDTIAGPKKIKDIHFLQIQKVYDIFEVDNEDHSFTVNHSIITKNCDELSSVDINKQQDFWSAIRPTLSTGGKCIVTSTPGNDEDIFAQIYQGACDTFDEYGNEIPNGIGRNGFKALKYIWSDNPNRDESWEKAERAAMGDESTFAREHLCDFVSSDETLINGMILSTLKGKDPIETTGAVRWYSKPLPNRTYLISLDPSMGTGGDESAIQVFQLPEMIQVAEWKHNKTDIPGQLKTLREIGKYIIECQKESNNHREGSIYWTLENNNIGEAANIVIKEIGEDMFPGTYLSSKSRGIAKKRKGFCMTNKMKVEACSKFKSLVERGKITLNSKALISQLKVFVARGASYAAKGSEKDDLVMATLLIIKMLERVMIYDDTINDDFREAIDDEPSERQQPFFGIF